jgi:hypothetical protein
MTTFIIWSTSIFSTWLNWDSLTPPPAHIRKIRFYGTAIWYVYGSHITTTQLLNSQLYNEKRGSAERENGLVDNWRLVKLASLQTEKKTHNISFYKRLQKAVHNPRKYSWRKLNILQHQHNYQSAGSKASIESYAKVSTTIETWKW